MRKLDRWILLALTSAVSAWGLSILSLLLYPPAFNGFCVVVVLCLIVMMALMVVTMWRDQ